MRAVRAPRLQRILTTDHIERSARQRGQAAAQQIQAGRDIGAHGRGRRIGLGAGADEFNLIVATNDHHDIVLEIGLEPGAEVAHDPVRLVLGADRHRCARRAGDAVELTEHPYALVGDRLPDEPLFAIERDIVGALRRGQNRNDHANDRDGNDDTDRQDQADAGAVPPRLTRAFALPGNALLQSKRHASILLLRLVANIGRKRCKSLAN